MLQQVRWSQLSPLERETLLSSLPQPLPHSQLRCEGGLECEGRGWPQQLLLVSAHRGRLSIHWYDLQRKCWSVLATRNISGWRRKIGVTQISGDRLVFTQLNTDSPWRPFSVSVYDVWANSWSLEEQTPVKPERGGPAQSVVSLKDEVFTVLSEELHGQLVLCGASRLTSPSPIYTMYGPLPGQNLADNKHRTGRPCLVLTGTRINVIHGQTVSTYDTATHSWEQSQVGGSVVGSSWLGLSDGRVLRCGGVSQETGRSSSHCSVFTGGLAGQPLTLGSLSYSRKGASLAQFKGHVFAAGGNRRSDGSASRSKREVLRSFVEYYVPNTDIWHPLPVQPPLSHSASVLALLVVNTPIRSLHPRALSTSFPQSNNFVN